MEQRPSGRFDCICVEHASVWNTFTRSNGTHSNTTSSTTRSNGTQKVVPTRSTERVITSVDTASFPASGFPALGIVEGDGLSGIVMAHWDRTHHSHDGVVRALRGPCPEDRPSLRMPRRGPGQLAGLGMGAAHLDGRVPICLFDLDDVHVRACGKKMKNRICEKTA